MAEYPGVVRMSAKYIGDTLSSTVQYAVYAGVICSPVLILGLAGNVELWKYMIFTFIGICGYLGQLDMGDELEEVGNEEDSAVFEVLLQGLIVLYYNLVLFVGFILSAAIGIAMNPAIGLSVAVVYCAYDAEMANVPYPTSIAGVVASAVALVALILEGVQKIRGVTEGIELLEMIRRIKDSPEILAKNMVFTRRKII